MSATLARSSTSNRTLLAASVALNVFLLALVGSHLLITVPARREAGGEGPFRRILAALPPADADRFRAVLDRERPAYQPARDAMSAAHMAVADAIGRTPLDEVRVRAALKEWQASWLAFTNRFSDTFLDAVSVLSDQGREKLRETMAADDQRRLRQGE